MILCSLAELFALTQAHVAPLDTSYSDIAAARISTYSGNLISTYSWGLAFMNRTRSSPACSIMRTWISFLFVRFSSASAYLSIMRVRKGRSLSESLEIA